MTGEANTFVAVPRIPNPESNNMQDHRINSIKAALLLCAIVVLTACGAGERAASPEPLGDGTYVYVCRDDYRFSARFQDDSAFVSLPDQELRLPQVVAASGIRYAAGDVVLWTKGDEATLETPGGDQEECRGQRVDSPWERSRLLGFEFRGIGQEPGWIIEIESGRMIRIALDYATRWYYLPGVEPIRDDEGRIRYEIEAEGVSARVEIEEAPCQDPMSGEEFTHRVGVRIDGGEYEGCGRILRTGLLIGTRWSLAELGGRPAVVGADGEPPYIRLLRGEDRVVGSTGCNSISGGYLHEGERLEFDQIATTLRACVDPEITRQEREFSRALESTNRHTIESDTLILYQDDEVLARFEARYLR